MSNSFYFTSKELQILTAMKGQQFNNYKSDPFVYSPMVFGIVGISVGDETYKITAQLKETQRFNSIDEVVCLQIEKADSTDIGSLMDGGEMVETPVMNKIDSIMVVTDFQTLTKDSDEKEFARTIGCIFKMFDGLEISFEVGCWYSEMITVRKGYNLIEDFTPVEEFYEEWEGTGFDAKSKREVKII